MNYNEIFDQNLCRLCAKTKDKLLPIFDSSGSRFDDKIKDCMPLLNIKYGDGQPQQICLDCVTKLNMFHEFLGCCLETQKKLDSLPNEPENCIWVGEADETGLQNEGVIVLSKLDSAIDDSVVVKVELKYKDSGKKKNILLGTVNQDAKEPKIKTIDKKSKNKNTIFECNFCDKSFKRRTRLNYHMSIHTALKPHKCDLCDKTFAMRWDLNLHKKVHTRTFACSSCDKVFVTKSKLDRHTRVHTGEKPFKCQDCGKCFGEKRNLDNHIRTHTGIRPFTCAVCMKTFTVRSHLVEHLNVHKETSPFICNVCNCSFKWRTTFKRHAKLHQ